MKHLTIEYKYQGKWIAIKDLKVIGSGNDGDKLKAKFDKRNEEDISYMLVPKGRLVGGFAHMNW